MRRTLLARHLLSEYDHDAGLFGDFDRELGGLHASSVREFIMLNVHFNNPVIVGLRPCNTQVRHFLRYFFLELQQ